MSTLHLLWYACIDGDLEQVKILATNENVNVMLPNCGYPITAAVEMGHKKVVQYLLSFPNIKPDLLVLGQTALTRSLKFIEITRILLQDPRVNVNYRDVMGQTALWNAIYQDDVNAVREILSCGKDVDTFTINVKGVTLDQLLASRKSRAPLSKLINDYRQDPSETRARLRRKEETSRTPSNLLFAAVVFVSDGLLALSDPPFPERKLPERHMVRARRFVQTASVLPIELQMILANRANKNAADYIRKADVENGLKELARNYIEES